MLDDKRAIHRVRSTHDLMRDYWKKVYRLRRIIAGDKDALISSAVGSNFDIGRGAARLFRENTPDILMQQFEEGRNNDMLNLLGTLIKQCCFYFPNIEAKGLTPHQQVVTSQYLRDRLTASNAIHHNRMALWDVVGGGIGAVYMPMEWGKPCVRWADTLDIKFDQTARLICDVSWMSITVTQTLEKWTQVFGNAAFSHYLSGRKDDDMQVGMDLPFELEFYYDVEHEYKEKEWRGNYKVFVKTAENGYDEDHIVYSGPNPNFHVVQGERQPYLPFETVFYEALPGIRLPIGAAEKALPAQIAVWRSCRRLQDIIDGGPPFYEILKGMTEEDRAKFLEGMRDGLVELDANQIGTLKEHASLPINQTDIEEINRNREAMKEQLGTSNSLLGQPEKGVKFARDISAIQQQGSLTAGDLSKDNADFWGRWVPKFLGKAKLYDKKPFTAQVEGVSIDFGEKTQAGPIKDYLVPLAEYTVGEDSMKFIPPQVKAQRAQIVLDVAMQLAQQFPGGVAPAYQDFLVANGVENVEERMKQPPPMPAPMAMPGGAPVGPQGGGQPLSPQMSMETGTGG